MKYGACWRRDFVQAGGTGQISSARRALARLVEHVACVAGFAFFAPGRRPSLMRPRGRSSSNSTGSSSIFFLISFSRSATRRHRCHR
jgi:hypothetical protein